MPPMNKRLDEIARKIDKKYPTKQNNNPKGYNKHKIKPFCEVVIIKPTKKEDVQKAYQELWKAKCIMLSKAQIYHRLFKEFMDLDKLKQEVEKEVKRLE